MKVQNGVSEWVNKLIYVEFWIATHSKQYHIMIEL